MCIIEGERVKERERDDGWSKKANEKNDSYKRCLNMGVTNLRNSIVMIFLIAGLEEKLRTKNQETCTMRISDYPDHCIWWELMNCGGCINPNPPVKSIQLVVHISRRTFCSLALGFQCALTGQRLQSFSCQRKALRLCLCKALVWECCHWLSCSWQKHVGYHGLIFPNPPRRTL